jgi:predicted TIM-barrel fold metal-dependent hydrolase
MPIPKDIRVIDLHVNIPTSEHNKEGYDKFRSLLRDRESLDNYRMPAQHFFKDPPSLGADKSRYVEAVVAEMDKHNIGQALIGVTDGFEHFGVISDRYADRFIFGTPVDPNGGVDEVRRIKRMHRDYGIKAASFFPAGSTPQIAINAKEMYPIYATCCELDIPILVNVGVPGPRIPMATQKVEFIDEVCWFFPELKFVMRHGAEPWVDLAIKLMLKWPNLYYSTSAFAPKHYPKAIIEFANKRGADKIMYAGYFPAGLTLDRIFAELEQVPFTDAVWPKFLRGNAARVFNLV